MNEIEKEVRERRRAALVDLLETDGFGTAAEVLRADLNGQIEIHPANSEAVTMALREHLPELFGERRPILFVGRDR